MPGTGSENEGDMMKTKIVIGLAFFFTVFTSCFNKETDTGTVENYSVDAEQESFAIKGIMILPELDSLTGGRYTISIENNTKTRIYETSGDWINGEVQDFSMENIRKDIYNRINVAVFNSSNKKVYSYSTVTSLLTVENADVAGFVIYLLKQYNISGTIKLPDSDVVVDGSYELYVWNVNTMYYEISGSWNSGNTLEYAITVPEGDYYYIEVYLYDKSGEVSYRAHINTVLSVSEDDVILNIQLERINELYGTISLRNNGTLQGGRYHIYLSDGSKWYAAEGDWGSGNTQQYKLTAPEGAYSWFQLDIYDANNKQVYGYFIQKTVLNLYGDLNYNATAYKYYTISGEITLPDTQTLSDGKYYVFFTSSLRNYNAAYCADGKWVSGNSLQYTLQIPEGSFDELLTSVYNKDDILVYQYYVKLVNFSVSGDIPEYNISVEQI